MNNYYNDLDWKIGMHKLATGEQVYYIYGYADKEKDEDCKYIHKNGTVHALCGDPGFFKTREEAENMLPWQKIPDELFEI